MISAYTYHDRPIDVGIATPFQLCRRYMYLFLDKQLVFKKSTFNRKCSYAVDILV